MSDLTRISHHGPAAAPTCVPTESGEETGLQETGAHDTGSSPLFQVGSSFMHPVLDYLLIGGGLSLLVVAGAWLGSGEKSADAWLGYLPAIFLLSNSAHFASSTVRMYTRPNSFRTLPFLTMTFPVVALSVTSLAIMFPEHLGRHLIALFVVWSPFHYSAQTYGLSVMYCYRSGCKLSDGQRRLLRWCCMITFVKTAVGVPHKDIGIWWIIPWSSVSTYPGAEVFVDAVVFLLGVLAFGLPAVLYYRVRHQTGTPMPLISMLIVLTNALWFFAFRFFDGLAWATVFHGVQYLAVVTVFHVKDQMRLPENRHGRLYHTVWFYGVSLILAYLIFRGWPSAYMLFGFGYVESSLMVVAAINIHHFIVDGYIWRLRKDPNYRNVTDSRQTVTQASA